VLLFNSRLKIFPGKLRSRWTGPYTITKVSPHGYVELLDEASKQTFTANGHRVKHYFGGPWSKEESVQLLTRAKKLQCRAKDNKQSASWEATHAQGVFFIFIL